VKGRTYIIIGSVLIAGALTWYFTTKGKETSNIEKEIQ
tara:strand:- start:9601 stop:9714 length:114 start_codon:yes stop_codon:yes gene_type:complete